ncbi:Lysozyme-like protein 5 [Caenorhabditis elegans]|uniref:Lysozyme-like protein 5 n=1 Tax=Caenorhabditis elegans TaxID=6239 RepID=LYS5_CAEEL|nr:Lysozyme-like protein 5 [Caenorhabditis elegans]Q20967.1 RecName: Full=Lysozyme-like protein 5; Flags: Precursor [Caenorhabditis elegans]CAA97800.1 Lysozyme-like protein 5 [Caenorhabditis elegans]|eukprot:NP_502193.1 Lysozyme-like protein 5 [Caenorhabditis elegans]
MKHFFITILLFCSVVSAARNGIDINSPVSTSTFTCIKNAGFSFIIPRIYHSSGSVDTVGVQNVKNARAAGLTDVDGYIFPCLKSTCASAANQVKASLDAVKAAGTKISTLWLDIERLNWPADHASNRAFIEAMVSEAKAYGQQVGIYSNYYNWQDIVGLDYHGQSSLMLWWPAYDGVKDFSKYAPFGGWSKPTIHQWSDTTTGPCGVSVDMNYIP